MPITKNQLEILRDMFAEYDDDGLMDHIDIQQIDRRKFVLEFDDVNGQDMEQLFEQKG